MNRQTDLIAIANSELAEKLAGLEKTNAEQQTVSDNKGSFKQDIWKAVYILNIIRYLVGLILLIVITLQMTDKNWNFLSTPISLNFALFCTILLLASAIVFSYESSRKKSRFNTLLVTQFSLDAIFVALLMHNAGGIESNLTLLYMFIVATGSVVLPRVHGLGLASGAIILLFIDYFYSISFSSNSTNLTLLVKYSISLFVISLLISYLAKQIVSAERRKFIPGKENIEDFLVREEKQALQAALQKTDGIKTEAAKLLGMSFRSFRYKLSKYNIA